jgi:tRNA-2-methylthio-N6-dimethylallyladenosine synthase
MSEAGRGAEDLLIYLRKYVNLAAEGYKEVTLLGQNVNSYGKDLDEKLLFPQLLRKINEIDEIERIRFMTSHPKDLSDDLIQTMAECDKVCKHLHLPIQAGSNRILRKMNRKYSREVYMELVEKLRSAMPDIALTTDIIVGFPGETEEDFLETLSAVEQIRYDSAFTFVYSPRRGTSAAKMKEQILQSEKKQRLARLNELVNKISKEKNLEYLDRNVKVLVEGYSKNRTDILTGRTDTNKIVNFKGYRPDRENSHDKYHRSSFLVTGRKGCETN